MVQLMRCGCFDMNAPLNPTQLQIDVLQHAVTTSTQHESAHLHVLLARVYVATARTPLALEQLIAALALDPSNPEATQLQSQLKR